MGQELPLQLPNESTRLHVDPNSTMLEYREPPLVGDALDGAFRTVMIDVNDTTHAIPAKVLYEELAKAACFEAFRDVHNHFSWQRLAVITSAAAASCRGMR